MDTSLFTRLFAHVANPPTFKVINDEHDGPFVKIEGTPFYVTSNSIKVAGIAGATVRQYTLAVETEDDYFELYTSNYLQHVVTKAVAEYIEWLCRNTLDEMAWDAYAADLEEDKRMLQAAYDEGKAYYNATPAHQRDTNANPYPYGIDHYKKWVEGYRQAEAESVF